MLEDNPGTKIIFIQKLNDFLLYHYSLQDLRTLCFELNVEFENLAGSEARDAKIRELLLTLGKQNRFDSLLEYLERTRPLGFKENGLREDATLLDKLYAELEAFEISTRPIQEQLIRRVGMGQLLGFSLLATLVITAVGVLYFLLQPKSPETMSGHFRIAVAEFVETNNSDNDQIGKELAQDAFLQLQKTFNAMALGFVVTIWGPEQVGKISGDTSDERASSAALLANQIKADLIIYGVVDTNDAEWLALPEFYIAETNFYQAEEITGQHELGAPFPIAGQGNIAGRINASEEMTLRTQVLSHIVVGLAFYAIRDYEKATENYLLINEINGWQENEGSPIIPLLLGNAAAKNNDLDSAERYYQQSVTFDPEYARGFLGVSNLHYRRALEPFEASGDPSDTNQELLTLALQTLQTAESIPNQLSSADIAVKAHFERGQIYFMQVYSGGEGSFETAFKEFTAVINNYDNGANPRIRELAAESHARLAVIYDLSGDTQKSIEEYLVAAKLLDISSERRALYEERAQKLQHPQSTH